MKNAGIDRTVKGLCLLSLLILVLSPPPSLTQGQPRGRSNGAEIIFSSKDEKIWAEKREIPLPVVMAQGMKEEPRIDSNQATSCASNRSWAV